jgi:CBS-domain-containing membrane protein
VLWSIKKNLRWATRISSRIGSGFGILLIVFGLFSFLSGNFIGGMWWFLIGMFINGAAKASYQQLITRRALEGEPVSRFMKNDPITVPEGISLEDLVENYVYRHHHKMYPVTSDSDALLGCINTKQLKEIPRDEWKNNTVKEIAKPCSAGNTIEPSEDSMKALSIMNKNSTSRLLVVEKGALKGIISLKDMLKFLSLKVELEE